MPWDWNMRGSRNSRNWHRPQKMLKHKGVVVYYTYKNGKINAPVRMFCYTINPHCGEGECVCGRRSGHCQRVFDVRTLSTISGLFQLSGGKSLWGSQKNIRAVITAAIDLGEITPTAVYPFADLLAFLNIPPRFKLLTQKTDEASYRTLGQRFNPGIGTDHAVRLEGFQIGHV